MEPPTGTKGRLLLLVGGSNWKKHLYTTYVKKNIAPDFTIPSPISKQRSYWDEFVQYKTSEEDVSWVIKNQHNAQ